MGAGHGLWKRLKALAANRPAFHRKDIHPNFFIGIGAQKSGSTWLHRQLYNHPQIWVPPLKELRYFDGDDEGRARDWLEGRYKRNRNRARTLRRKGNLTDDERFHVELVDWLEGAVKRTRRAHGLDFYRQLFADKSVNDYKAFGEVTPTYSSMGEPGFSLLRDLQPNVKMLFVMRDPKERAWSIAKHVALKSRDDPALLDSESFLSRFTSDRWLYGCGRYDWTMEHVERLFRPDQLMCEFYEEIFSGREATYAFLEKLCEFIGIDYDPAHFPKAGEVVLATEKRNMSAAADAVFGPAFAPVYDYIEARFGSLPKGWTR